MCVNSFGCVKTAELHSRGAFRTHYTGHLHHRHQHQRNGLLYILYQPQCRIHCIAMRIQIIPGACVRFAHARHVLHSLCICMAYVRCSECKSNRKTSDTRPGPVSTDEHAPCEKNSCRELSGNLCTHWIGRRVSGISCCVRCTDHKSPGCLAGLRQANDHRGKNVTHIWLHLFSAYGCIRVSSHFV